MIYIKQCKDPLMWYANKVGQTVELLREEDDCYISREDEGFPNIVKKEDGELYGPV